MTDDFSIQVNTNKMIELWNKVADGWHKWSNHIDVWSRDATIKMFQEVDINKGSKVLDVAAGNGNQSLLVAEIVGAQGYVLTTDISESLLKFAKQNAEEKGYTQIETKLMQAENLDVANEFFDAVICKNGLMLFIDKWKAVGEIFRVLKPGGKFSAIVFSTPQNNPWISIPGKMMMEAADISPPKASEPSLFSLSQPQEIEDLLDNSGFTNISVSKIKQDLKVPRNINFVEFLEEAPGMIVLMFNQLSFDEKLQVRNNIRQAFQQFQTDDGYSFPGEFLVLSGRKPKI